MKLVKFLMIFAVLGAAAGLKSKMALGFETANTLGQCAENLAQREIDSLSSRIFALASFP